MNYDVIKVNGYHSHVVADCLNNKQGAIELARKLHHPDWPIWQYLYVVPDGCDGDARLAVFDSRD